MFPFLSASFVRGKDNGHVGRHNGHPTSNVGPIPDRKSCLTFALLILPLPFHTPTFTTIILPPPSLRDRMSSVPSLMMEVKKEADYEHELFFLFFSTQKALHFGHLWRENIKSSPRRLHALWAVYTSALPRDRPETAQSQNERCGGEGLLARLQLQRGRRMGDTSREKREERGRCPFSFFPFSCPRFKGPQLGWGEDFF